MKVILSKLGIESKVSGLHTGIAPVELNTNDFFESFSPVDGRIVGTVQKASIKDYESTVERALKAFQYWRQVPSPVRGDLVRKIGNRLREFKEPLGQLVSYEMGKSLQEGLGEVQEMIDIADFSVGLSRQLYGQTMHSERPVHRMYEQWHPLGVVGIISAFNFPVAVWSWNSFLAMVCGNVSIWKPSEKTPLSAVACFNIIQSVLKENQIPAGVLSLIIGDVSQVGEPMLKDRRISLVSATGSTRMGRHVAQVVGQRLGKTLLELGGNNAIILTEKANLKLAAPAIVFGAVGTCGQRCTTTRRLIVHANIFDKIKDSLVKAYKGLRIGNPLDQQNHVGPLIDREAVDGMQLALKTAVEQGGKIIFGGQVLPQFESGCYVVPAIVEATRNMMIVGHETFAPILYLMKYEGTIDDAIQMQNEVDQGLSSSIFTDSLMEAEQFLSHWGSDCGIANVNIGTSGAEIGGAFGGEKDTGGGRESGSDSWKSYMRRQTNTINFSSNLPLAQGIKFDL
ncbi:MAG: aldehyde dehydrogenase family protein [Proteobacteria bacterium]|nr:aldehyde dehydrogenase family protein [Pseudomonadota bacterium]